MLCAAMFELVISDIICLCGCCELQTDCTWGVPTTERSRSGHSGDSSARLRAAGRQRKGTRSQGQK